MPLSSFPSKLIVPETKSDCYRRRDVLDSTSPVTSLTSPARSLLNAHQLIS